MLTLPGCNDTDGKWKGEVWNYTVNERLWEVEDFSTEPIEAETTYLNVYFMYFMPIHRCFISRKLPCSLFAFHAYWYAALACLHEEISHVIVLYWAMQRDAPIIGQSWFCSCGNKLASIIFNHFASILEFFGKMFGKCSLRCALEYWVSVN